MSANAVPQVPRSVRGPFSATEGQLTTLKWIGVAAMVVDHIGRYSFGLGLDSWAFAVGRIAFPIFAAVLGIHLARYGTEPARIARTAWRLAIWAALSAVPSWLAREEWLPVNVFATLALGAMCCLAGGVRGSVAKVGALVVLLMMAVFVEFSVPGVLLVWTVYAWACRPTGSGAAIGCAAAIVGLGLTNGLFGGSGAALGSIAGVGAVAAAGLLPTASRRTKWFFYSVYPAHLLAIGVALAFQR